MWVRIVGAKHHSRTVLALRIQLRMGSNRHTGYRLVHPYTYPHIHNNNAERIDCDFTDSIEVAEIALEQQSDLSEIYPAGSSLVAC